MVAIVTDTLWAENFVEEVCTKVPVDILLTQLRISIEQLVVMEEQLKVSVNKKKTFSLSFLQEVHFGRLSIEDFINISCAMLGFDYIAAQVAVTLIAANNSRINAAIEQCSVRRKV